MKKRIVLLCSLWLVAAAYGEESNIPPVADQTTDPTRAWFYNAETVAHQPEFQVRN
jgi:hypothetical protein